MSDWHPKIKAAASFRGVSFFIESAEQRGGRRTVRHEFPFKPLPFSEDMGLRGRLFPLEAFVVGVDYMDQREALIAALESENGPGELVHPHFGTRRCAVPNYRVRETSAEGGVARFSIEFEETPEKPSQPSAVKDSATLLQAGAAAAVTAVGAEFLASFSPGSVLDSVIGAVKSATRAIDGVLAKVEMETQALAQLKQQVGSLSSSAVALVNAPASLLDQNVLIFQTMADGLIASATINPCAALLSLYAFDLGPRPPLTTPSRIQERANYDAAQRLHQRLVVIQAARIAVTQNFASFDDAVATRSTITDLLDEQAEVASDDTFPAMAQLRADLVNAVPGTALEFARLLSYTPANSVPSLVLAHRLYGDLSLEQDVVARNKIRNPAFVTGGVPLEVLSRVD